MKKYRAADLISDKANCRERARNGRSTLKHTSYPNAILGLIWDDFEMAFDLIQPRHKRCCVEHYTLSKRANVDKIGTGGSLRQTDVRKQLNYGFRVRTRPSLRRMRQNPEHLYGIRTSRAVVD
jgi:hypothetical protein